MRRFTPIKVEEGNEHDSRVIVEIMDLESLRLEFGEEPLRLVSDLDEKLNFDLCFVDFCDGKCSGNLLVHMSSNSSLVVLIGSFELGSKTVIYSTVKDQR